jgi:hypothetical protein
MVKPIRTFTGRLVYPLDMKPGDICIEDIAHALSNLCRFNGHSARFFSVAEHSWHVSQVLPRRHALWGLLHDASEAYLNDMVKPIKEADGFEAYRDAEHRLERVIADVFGLSWPRPEEFTLADRRLLITEQRDLFGREPRPSDPQPLSRKVTGWFPSRAEATFLYRFRMLYPARRAA